MSIKKSNDPLETFVRSATACALQQLRVQLAHEPLSEKQERFVANALASAVKNTAVSIQDMLVA